MKRNFICSTFTCLKEAAVSTIWKNKKVFFLKKLTESKRIIGIFKIMIMRSIGPVIRKFWVQSRPGLSKKTQDRQSLV